MDALLMVSRIGAVRAQISYASSVARPEHQFALCKHSKRAIGSNVFKVIIRMISTYPIFTKPYILDKVNSHQSRRLFQMDQCR